MKSNRKPCTECLRPTIAPYVPDLGGQRFIAGDICSIIEMTSTPIYLLLTGKIPPSRGASASNMSWGTTGFAKWVRAQAESAGEGGSDEDEKGRPAVILGPTTMSGEVQVCLMATFDGTEFLACLPPVLQHFCIPIYPHVEIRPDGPNHSHVTPSWPVQNTWLIALPFDCKMNQITGRWEDRRIGTPFGASYRLSPVELRRLEGLCSARRMRWDALVAHDAKLRERSLTEYKVHMKRAAERRNAERAAMKTRHGSIPKLPPTPASTTDHRDSDIQLRPRQAEQSTTTAIASGYALQGTAGPSDGTSAATSLRSPATKRSHRWSYAQIIKGFKPPAREPSPSNESTHSKTKSLMDVSILQAAKKMLSSSSRTDVSHT
ncbi:hypothetical protein FKP32DRAFT_1643997 [Trametes sanguinea]|nr:hypothetical protein FKP32DRAFT_1643997 [Trametes sanguinea]